MFRRPTHLPTLWDILLGVQWYKELLFIDPFKYILYYSVANYKYYFHVALGGIKPGMPAWLESAITTRPHC